MKTKKDVCLYVSKSLTIRVQSGMVVPSRDKYIGILPRLLCNGQENIIQGLISIELPWVNNLERTVPISLFTTGVPHFKGVNFLKNQASEVTLANICMTSILWLKRYLRRIE